jgi:putative ABC transport system substrate-binding protein
MRLEMRIIRKACILLISMLIPVVCTAAGAVEVGLSWVGVSGMTNRVEKGFRTGVADIAPALSIETAKELKSIAALSAVVQRWETEKKGMVILRSSGAKWLGEHPPSIPAFIGGCNHPVQLGAVENMESPGGNITGVTYYLPKKIQFDVFRVIIPRLKSVFLLLEEGHPGSVIDRKETREVCEALGIRFRAEVFSDIGAVLSKVREINGAVDAVILSSTRLMMDNAASIVPAAGDTPVFSYAYRPVKDGALGGFVADDIKLGYMLAESVADVLLRGKPIRSVPIKTDPDPRFVVNIRTAERLSLEIPYHILEAAEIVY